MGQHIASLDYILPREYCTRFSSFTNAAPESPISLVTKTITEDLCRDSNFESLEQIFDEFDASPVGVASLAQVHRARLKTGDQVAVKVQHYFVSQLAEVDLFISTFVVNLAEFFFPDLSLRWLVLEMATNIPLELDFRKEGENSERLQRYIDSTGNVLKSRIYIPKIRWEVSSKRVLVMDFVDGIPVTDVDALAENGIPVFGVLHVVHELFNQMIFKYGWVHCDPHPGNILIKRFPNASSPWYARIFHSSPRWKLVLLDHGLYKNISPEFQTLYAFFWLSILSGSVSDIDKYGRKILAFSDALEKPNVDKMMRLFSCILTQRSWGSIESGRIKESEMADYTELEQIRIRAPEFFSVTLDLLASLPRPFLLLLKTNELLRHLTRQLVSSGKPSSLWSLQSYWLGFSHIVTNAFYCVVKEIGFFRAIFSFYRIYFFSIISWIPLSMA